MPRAQNNSWEYLREKLRAQMNDMSDHVSGGACKEFSDYQKCCGIIEGLALAERELLDYVQRNLEK